MLYLKTLLLVRQKNSPMKIFLVEDDPLFNELMKDHLSKNTMFEVRIFNSGDACMEHLFENPDVIILDYHLDNINQSSDNGLAVLDKIKKASPLVHVVMLSSQQHYGVAAQTIAKGAEQYVMKDENTFKNIDLILKDFSKAT